MDTQVYRAVNTALRQSFVSVTAERKIFISYEARHFLHDQVSEFLQKKSGEWKKRNMDPDNAGAAPEIARVISGAVIELLMNAPVTGKTAAGQDRLLVRDIIKKVRNFLV